MRNRRALSLLLGLLVAALVAPAAQAAQSPLVMRDVNLGLVTGIETFSITASNRSDEPHYFSVVSLSGAGADIDGWVQDPALVNECRNLFDTRHPAYLGPGESCTAQFRVQPVEGAFGRMEFTYCIGQACATIRGRVGPS
jgi:hypothetical protein